MAFLDETGVQNLTSDIKVLADERYLNKNTSFRPNQLKRRWLFIGDSYGTASSTGNGWINKLVTLMGLTSSDYYSSAIGGAGFTTSSTNNFITQLTNLSNGITDEGKLTFTDIVVLGGANDIGQTAETISTAIKNFVSYANNTFPNAQVFIGMIGGCADPAKVALQYSRTKEAYSDCGKAIYLHNLEYVFQNRSLLGSDNVHPTAAGYTLLSEKIYEALNGGCNVIYRDIGVAPVWEADFSTVYTGATYSVIVSNNITSIFAANRIGKVTSSSSKYFAISQGSPVLLVRLNSNLFLAPERVNGYTGLIMPCFARVHSTINSTFYNIKGYAVIYASSIGNNGLFFVPNDNVLGTTGAFSSCDAIEIDGFNFTIPSIMC